MKIGILQTGKVPENLRAQCGEYPDMFEQLLSGNGFTFASWAVVDGVFPDHPNQADGWLITGSRHGVYEDHDWLPPLEAFIRKIVSDEKPLVGICFGHQIIAQALGGHVEKFEGGWSIGPQVYEFADGPKAVHAWHQDQVTTPPAGAQTIAKSDFCAHAALLYPSQALTYQPHPEFDDAFPAGLIETRGPGVVPDDLLQEARAQLGVPLDRAQIGAQIAHFLKHKALP